MKNLIVILLSMLCINANAQIFNNKEVLDKFDDVISQQNVKTLIQKNDTEFIIEEKGKQPIIYKIINFATYNSFGDKNNIVNIINNVYGYQECWFVVLEKDYENYNNELFIIYNEPDETKRLSMITETLNKYGYYITHRVVTTEYTHSFIDEFIWVQKGDNNGRTIYSNK